MAITEEPRRKRRARKWTVRLAWLFGLWLGGVATLSMVAWLLRSMMRAAGLH
jgi:hypothetical protein